LKNGDLLGRKVNIGFGMIKLGFFNPRQTPAFKAMLNIMELDDNDRKLLAAAEEHLKSYPETYVNHKTFARIFNQRLRDLLSKYGNRIKLPGRDFIRLEPVAIKKNGFLGKLGATETIFKRKDVPYMMDLEGNLNEQQIQEIKELETALLNKKAFNEKYEIYRQLAGDISVLILKIEMGEPLEGHCSLCPKVRILDKKGVES